MIFDDTIATLQEFLDQQNRFIEEAVKANADVIVEANVAQMYELGETRTGESIVPPYSPAYKRQKERKGQRTDHVTLRDTGDFHASIKVEYFNEGFEIVATDWKTPYLTKRYTPMILGLKDEALQAFCQEFIIPHIQTQFKTLFR